MEKKEIVRIFKDIADKVESGNVILQCKSTCVSIPFTTVNNYMEFTDRSELEFTYKSHLMAELTPTVTIYSSDIENIIFTKAEKDDLFGEHEIKFVCDNNISIIATVILKENQQFEWLKLEGK